MSLVSLVLLAAPAAASPAGHRHEPLAVRDAAATVTVFKSPECGCCRNWVEHMRKHGYTVIARDVSDVAPLKTAHGVPQRLWSCHTALVAGYVIEGHVPADLVARLLREKPAIVGLAVPGMVQGSPGMEGGVAEHYDVLAFDKLGHTTVYARR